MIKDLRKLVLASLLAIFMISTGCGCKNNQMNRSSYKPMPKSSYQGDDRDRCDDESGSACQPGCCK